MNKRENKELKKVYNAAYKKGENQHYTRLIFSKGKLTNDKKAILAELSWKGKRVLDVGCGTGEVAYRIAKKGGHVTGIDYSVEAISVAMEKYRHPNLEYRVMDLKEIDGTFDVVISMGTLEHTDDPFGVLKELASHVKKGGSLILTCPNWLNPRGYMLQTLARLFRAKITLADIHYLTPVEFSHWAKLLKLSLKWKTVDHDWGHGKKLVEDFRRRIPNVLRDSNLPTRPEWVDEYISWIESHIVPFERSTKYGGVTGVYHLRKK
jgi:2-polyprenyl-3-methyl-5-hydroxy-6-metoxy-1,4-benzoquinol methylase